MCVEPLGSFSEVEEAGAVTPYSLLFRQDTHLTEVLGLALEKAGSEELFRVISAGCSFGAEIDSVLATVQYNSPRPIAVLGVDANPKAVEAAQTGEYQLTTSLETHRGAYKRDGINFDEATQHMKFSFAPDEFNPGLHTLHTAELRAQHRVMVKEANLAHGLPTEKLAQVVMCNNVLFHLDSETAGGIADDLARHVAVDGILSFGANPAQTGMEANTGVDYLTWLQDLGTKLEGQGMEPVLFSQDVAFAFRRQGD